MPKRQTSDMRSKKKTSLLVTILTFLAIGVFVFLYVQDYIPDTIKDSLPADIRQLLDDIRDIFHPGKPRTIPTPELPTPTIPTPLPIGKQQGNTKIKTFGRAKSLLYRTIYAGHHVTFYCGSTYTDLHNISNTKSGFHYRKSEKRASQIEAEHMLPASIFGEKFDAWTQGNPACVKDGKPYRGRTCAEDVSPEFNFMESDLYNLVPAIGEVNGDRSDRLYGIVDGEAREYGACDFEVDFNLDIAEPAPGIRGDIARTYFYMMNAYPKYISFPAPYLAMLKGWDESDPVDAWECERAKRIQAAQGNENLIVAEACKTME